MIPWHPDSMDIVPGSEEYQIALERWQAAVEEVHGTRQSTAPHAAEIRELYERTDRIADALVKTVDYYDHRLEAMTAALESLYRLVQIETEAKPRLLSRVRARLRAYYL